MSQPLIFSLRPQPDCAEDVSELQLLGVDAQALPMLNIQPDQLVLERLRAELSQKPDIEVILTSKQAARIVVPWYGSGSDMPKYRMWRVGSATAGLLEKAGFANICVADSDAHSLVQKILQKNSNSNLPAHKQTHYLWLSGVDISLDIEAELSQQGYSIARHILYKAEANNPKGDDLKQALKNGRPCAFMAMSERTITLFADWLACSEIDIRTAGLVLFVSSKSQAVYAAKLGFDVVGVGARHRRDMPSRLRQDMLDQVVQWQRTSSAKK